MYCLILKNLMNAFASTFKKYAIVLFFKKFRKLVIVVSLSYAVKKCEKMYWVKPLAGNVRLTLRVWIKSSDWLYRKAFVCSAWSKAFSFYSWSVTLYSLMQIINKTVLSTWPVKGKDGWGNCVSSTATLCDLNYSTLSWQFGIAHVEHN